MAVPLVFVTVTAPVVPPAGATTEIVVAVALLTVATTPLNMTVLPATVAIKLLPLIETGVFAVPDEGLIDVIEGAPEEGEEDGFFLQPEKAIAIPKRSRKLNIILYDGFMSLQI